MKKAVLMSIHHKWCEKIFNGSKTIEVRKSRPYIPTPFTVYVYQTKHKGGNATVREVLNSVYGGGKVIGSFVCDRIREIIPLGLRGFKLGAEWLKEMCLSKEQLDEYGGLKTLYSWHITEPKLFDEPLELKHFIKGCDDMLDPQYGSYCGYCPHPCNITRPPQSWCYVEEEK